jgi:hypothetical protein
VSSSPDFEVLPVIEYLRFFEILLAENDFLAKQRAAVGAGTASALTLPGGGISAAGIGLNPSEY